MSRLGKKAMQIPKGVEVKVTADHEINVKGPKGASVLKLVPGIGISVVGDQLTVECDENKVAKYSFHGLYRALIANMMIGVHTGFTKKLVLIGTGYRVALQGKQLELKVGFSHPTIFSIPEEIQAQVDKEGALILTSYDKQKLGEFAATLRAKKPPEPYKGKGIRYADEYVRKKAGKAAAAKK